MHDQLRGARFFLIDCIIKSRGMAIGNGVKRSLEHLCFYDIKH